MKKYVITKQLVKVMFFNSPEGITEEDEIYSSLKKEAAEHIFNAMKHCDSIVGLDEMMVGKRYEYVSLEMYDINDDTEDIEDITTINYYYCKIS